MIVNRAVSCPATNQLVIHFEQASLILCTAHTSLEDCACTLCVYKLPKSLPGAYTS